MSQNALVHPTGSGSVRTRQQAWRRLSMSFFRPLLAVAIMVGSLGLAVFPAAPAGAAGADDTTVTGTLRYLDKGEGGAAALRPIRYAEVEIWRFRPSLFVWTWNHDATVTTDSTGRFTRTFEYKQDVIFALRVRATNYAAVVWPDDTLHTVPFYSSPGAPGAEIQSKSTQPGQTLDFSYDFTDDWIAKHYNMAETVRAAFDFANVRRNPGDSDSLPRAPVQPTTLTGTWYNAPFDTVVINDTDTWNDSVIMHEYGHFLEEQLSSLPWIVSNHNGCTTKNIFGATVNSVEHAWMEGFSDWFAQAVRLANPGAGLTGPTTGGTSSVFGLEASPACAPPPGFAADTVENRVAGVLWDLIDTTNEPGDALSGYSTAIMQILDGEQDVPPGTGPWPDIQSFRNAWAARGLPLLELDAIFALNGIIPAWSAPVGNGSFVETLDGSLYRIVGGAALKLTDPQAWKAEVGCNFATKGTPCPIVRAASVKSFRTAPVDHTFVRAKETGKIYRVAGGAPLHLSSCAPSGIDGCPGVIDVNQSTVDALQQFPSDHTMIKGAETGKVYKIAGGAPLYLSTCAAPGVCSMSAVPVNQWTIDNLGESSANKHLRQFPADHTMIKASETGKLYKVAGGAALYVTNCGVPEVCWTSGVVVNQWTIDNLGESSTNKHLRPVPADGTFLKGIPSGNYWIVVNGHRTAQPAVSGAVALNDDTVRSLPEAKAPFGSVDAVTIVPGGILVSGWAADPDVPLAAINVHVYVNNVFSVAKLANASRPDVGAAFPAYGPRHGFSVTIPFSSRVAPTVCVYGINNQPSTLNPQLGCKVATAP